MIRLPQTKGCCHDKIIRIVGVLLFRDYGVCVHVLSTSVRISNRTRTRHIPVQRRPRRLMSPQRGLHRLTTGALY